ncbi:hypothetical protein E6W39_38420 [Kitasatospora acidiphila]|uniref:Nucleoside 2-deoxyribosyltransferase n=1 Tax=Kitasatospora acidiphila TaxID=2567942 RepID=A0A540WD92_9ACTN|nr:hypothetical protein [Kitasatospora acidiphila]TQF06993.1 hypothetical protein E6W39_38420 [Kitasatospora acidiphila]
MGNFTYSYRELVSSERDIVLHLLERAESLLAGSRFIPECAAWIEELKALISLIDPLGEDYSGSIAATAHDAQWHLGNSPRDLEGAFIVFSQYVGVARSLIGRPVKTVAAKVPQSGFVESRAVFHRRSLEPQTNLVFVLMPFSENWSDYIWRREVKQIVESIEGHSLICRRADDLYGHDVMVDVYESIATARIVIAEVTNRNANVFYELGLAHALGKDVIILAQDTSHIPFDLQRFRHCIYSNDGEGYDVLRNWLPEAVKAALNR